MGEVPREGLVDVLTFYNTGPLTRVCSALDRNPPMGCAILTSRARFYQYVTLNGRRITPVSRSLRNSAGSSIVRASWDGRIYSGEVLSVFDHLQTGLPATFASPLFAHIRWMKSTEDNVLDDDVWSPL